MSDRNVLRDALERIADRQHVPVGLSHECCGCFPAIAKETLALPQDSEIASLRAQLTAAQQARGEAEAHRNHPQFGVDQLCARIATLEAEAAARDQTIQLQREAREDYLRTHQRDVEEIAASARLVEALRKALGGLLFDDLGEDWPKYYCPDPPSLIDPLGHGIPLDPAEVAAIKALALTPASLAAEVAAERAVLAAGLDRFRLLTLWQEHIGTDSVGSLAPMAGDGCDDGCDCCEPTDEGDCITGWPIWRDLRSAGKTLDEALAALAALRAGRTEA